MLAHRNLAFMSLAYHADIDRIEPGHTKLHAAPLSHGTGLYALPHLFAGGHQVVLPGFDPQEVLESWWTLQRSRPTLAEKERSRLSGHQLMRAFRPWRYHEAPQT
jgi:hypothetical protein